MLWVPIFYYLYVILVLVNEVQHLSKTRIFTILKIKYKDTLTEWSKAPYLSSSSKGCGFPQLSTYIPILIYNFYSGVHDFLSEVNKDYNLSYKRVLFVQVYLVVFLYCLSSNRVNSFNFKKI